MDDFLPNENFYTFKIDDNHDEGREEMEEEEIIRIVEDNLANGAQVISNDGVFTPVIQEGNQKLVVEAIEGHIKLCLKQIEAFKKLDVKEESDSIIK